MKKITIGLLFFSFSILFSEDAKTLNEAKAELNFIKALKSKDVKFFEDSFAPSVFFQYVVKGKQFSEADYKNFALKKGILYDLFFNSDYVKKNINSNSVSFADAFNGSFGIAIHANSDDRFILSSITTIHNGLCYDVILNCGDDAKICEISGLNISGCSGLDNILLSKLPSEEIKLQRLKRKKYLKESREWISSGLQLLEIFDEKRKAIYGPNALFDSIFTGIEDGYGGVAYLLVKTKKESDFLLFYRHLTSINEKIMDSKTSLNPGTFIGNNERKVGIQLTNEPPKITIDGRTISGNPITSALTIQLLKGNL
ncbi:hypothetical protein CH352_13425 [Leptospira hartskeerlii]|uniref:Uncharacterized protein n=1 Tax=Leptospira hartskeerlii TaxID=2023177 RepID=A0A2M9XA46_9LEPT|nr:hypothetical protein [Leptospira hartskeerlii]PJZ24578.1 hypothetical protein CH357_16080 [Leptospira hartskeerlii]PJZ32809.1 hypothetical protein CH352_13425 [Leptospira hartskeerlii]